jgi:hypothetical protein
LGHDDSNDDDDDNADSEPAISEEGGRYRQAAFIVAAPRPCYISCRIGGAHFYVCLFRGERVVAGYVMWIYDT